MKGLRFFLLLLFMGLIGCVGAPPEMPEEVHSPRLGISQNSEGKVWMSWESDSSYFYTIYYRDGSNAWKELRSMRQVRGTGGTMTASDRANPRLPPRRYRLHFEKPQDIRSF